MSRVSLALTIVALLGALVILVIGFQVQVPFLSPGHVDKGFPEGLPGKVPVYGLYKASDERDCPYAGVTYISGCYYVTGLLDTERDERTMALIVEDIIRDENLEESQDRMVVVYFQTTPNGDYGDPVATAYAFRDEAVAKDILTDEEWQDATVIDSVYIFKS